MSPIAWVLRALILAYKYLLSPVLPMACRYQPSCSTYALEAVQRFGGWHGGWLAVRRIGRCHPWGGSGFDPVPEHWRRRARWTHHPDHHDRPGAPMARPAQPPHKQSLSAAAPGSKHAR